MLIEEMPEAMSMEKLIDVIQCAYYDTQDRRATPYRIVEDSHVQIRFSVSPDAPELATDKFVAELAERGLAATVHNRAWAVELTGEAAGFAYTIIVQTYIVQTYAAKA